MKDKIFTQVRNYKIKNGQGSDLLYKDISDKYPICNFINNKPTVIQFKHITDAILSFSFLFKNCRRV